MLRRLGLEGVDAVLEEGAANLEELKVIWGNPEDPLDFDAFCANLSAAIEIEPRIISQLVRCLRWLVQ